MRRRRRLHKQLLIFAEELPFRHSDKKAGTPDIP